MPVAELKAWRERKLADGALLEVTVPGWKAPLLALGSDGPALADLEAGRRPGGLDAAGDHDGRGSHVPRAARPGQRPRTRDRPVRLRVHLGDLHAGPQAVAGAPTRCRSCGATGSSRGSIRAWTGPTGTLVINGLWLEDEALAARRGVRRGAGARDDPPPRVPWRGADRRLGRAAAPAPPAPQGQRAGARPRTRDRRPRRAAPRRRGADGPGWRRRRPAGRRSVGCRSWKSAGAPATR